MFNQGIGACTKAGFATGRMRQLYLINIHLVAGLFIDLVGYLHQWSCIIPVVGMRPTAILILHHTAEFVPV